MASSKYEIPSEGKTLLDEAVCVLFAKKENVLFVITTNGVQSIIYGMGNTATVNTISKFSPSSGESITLGKLFQQGYYTRNLNNVVGDYSSVAELSWNNKAIIIATHATTNDEGKVYIIPMTQLGSGNLDVNNSLIFNGFNKVNDVITISY